MTEHPKTEKIYLTYKTRMLTEARLIVEAKFYNALMAWFSFCSIIFSILQIFGYYSGRDATLIFIGLSVGLFGLSIYVSTQNDLGKAAEFKSCYLKLKAVYEGGGSESSKMKRYDEILALYENQEDDDYDEMIFDAYGRGQKLYNSKGDIPLTRIVIAKVVISKACRYLFRGALVVSPVLILIFIPIVGSYLGAPNERSPIVSTDVNSSQ